MGSNSRDLPPRESPNPPSELEDDWSDKELIPMLTAVYGEPYEGHWKGEVRLAAENIRSLPIYEDFESTIERFRLLLVSPHTLTNAEMKDFGSLRDDADLCVAVFVRHFLNHGPYKLHSLGSGPNPDHPRQKTTVENRHTYIFGGKMSRKRGDTHWTSRKPHLQQHSGRDRRPAQIDERYNSTTKGSALKVGKSQAPGTARYMSKNEVTPSMNNRRGLEPAQSRPQGRTSSARPFANPAFDGPGVPLRAHSHKPIPGVSRDLKEPMLMQGPSRMYQQWDSSRTAVQPYTAPPHYKNSQNYPTLTQGNEPYEASYDYEHARPVTSPFDGSNHPYHHQGQTSTSEASLSAMETSLTGSESEPRVVNPTFQPSEDAKQLRMTASDFVPGVSEHNF